MNAAWLPLVALVSAVILAVWLPLGNRLGRTGLYVVFAVAVTVSVQLVGIYLVFATLIIPALASRRIRKRRILAGYGLSAVAYAAGLAMSAFTDLPAGPLIVCMLAAGGIALFSLSWPDQPAPA